jgi:hypothetical protein
MATRSRDEVLCCHGMEHLLRVSKYHFQLHTLHSPALMGTLAHTLSFERGEGGEGLDKGFGVVPELRWIWWWWCDSLRRFQARSLVLVSLAGIVFMIPFHLLV